MLHGVGGGVRLRSGERPGDAYLALSLRLLKAMAMLAEIRRMALS